MSKSKRPPKEKIMYDAGVYMIRNLKTGVSYIGASTDLTTRMRTWRGAILSGNVYYASQMREQFEGSKLEDLEFRVIEKVDIEYGNHRKWVAVYDNPTARPRPETAGGTGRILDSPTPADRQRP